MKFSTLVCRPAASVESFRVASSPWIYAMTTEKAERECYYAMEMTTLSIMKDDESINAPRARKLMRISSQFAWMKCGIDVVKNNNLRYI